MNTARWIIIGQGLAGTCLAWELWRRGADFLLLDREHGGSSRVAAGLVNPVTGKNFEPSARIAEFLPEALTLYAEVETRIGAKVWHALPVLRLADSEKEWNKMKSKASLPDVARWISAGPKAEDGWFGSIELTGGGRLDTRAFLDGSREFFRSLGLYQKSAPNRNTDGSHIIWCEGATGLITGDYGPHRCAKGEILTISASGWDETMIRVGTGGWLVPLGNGRFKAGSTYDWDHLDEMPTEAGMIRIVEIIRRLGGDDFEITAHEAGVRPILRRSEPLIGPLENGHWMFNGLGSKGSLYAPGMARRLSTWLLEGEAPEPRLDFRVFRNSTTSHP